MTRTHTLLAVLLLTLSARPARATSISAGAPIPAYGPSTVDWDGKTVQVTRGPAREQLEGVASAAQTGEAAPMDAAFDAAPLPPATPVAKLKKSVYVYDVPAPAAEKAQGKADEPKSPREEFRDAYIWHQDCKGPLACLGSTLYSAVTIPVMAPLHAAEDQEGHGLGRKILAGIFIGIPAIAVGLPTAVAAGVVKTLSELFSALLP